MRSILQSKVSEDHLT